MVYDVLESSLSTSTGEFHCELIYVLAFMLWLLHPAKCFYVGEVVEEESLCLFLLMHYCFSHL